MKKILVSSVVFLSLIFAFFITVSGTNDSSVDALVVKSYPNRTVYNTFEQFDTEGLSIVAIIGGEEKNVNLSDLKISYESDKCLRVGDEYVIITYKNKSIKLPVTVNRIEYALDELSTTGFSIVYNGEYRSYSDLLPIIVGRDGIPLKITAVGGGKDVGSYDISIDFAGESRDYIIPESRIVSMKITPMESEILWSNLSFVYDGKVKTPSAQFLNAKGERVNLSVVGSAINAGTYTATISFGDPNYIFSNTSAEYEIKKANYDMSSIKWSAENFTYDGSKKSVSLFGLPGGVSVIGYEGDVASEAGQYTAVATLKWDENNYNSPPVISHRWQILQAEYDLSQIKFERVSCVYDGQMHYPLLVGSMPKGADGISLQYSFSTGACHVDDGVVSVTISFSTTSRNYKKPQDMYSSVSITPLGINVVWQGAELNYSGQKQTPIATAKECDIKVSGGALTVGKYLAKAESRNKDYYVINDSFEFVIKKAENYWVSPPDKTTCYEGKTIVFTAQSKFGTPTYQFYADSAAKNKIDTPTSPGVYYAILKVGETMNYSELISSIIRVEILEIKPVAFIAELKSKDLVAFGFIDPDQLVCSVINNDGSTGFVDSSKVKIIYNSGDSLRKKDKSVTLKYGDFIYSLEVEVEYADYDLSSAVWLNSTAVYSGKPLTPMLYGLPDGVRVVDYLGSDVINAGEYVVKAVLEYDSENYNEPIVEPCYFVIEKQKVEIPYIKAVYNGSAQLPEGNGELYSITANGNYINVGLYGFTVRLKDTDNYVFAETSGGEANGLFEIQPAKVVLQIGDVRLHLLEKITYADYSVIDGTVFGDDDLNLGFYLNNGYVFAESDNTNYSITVKAGRVERLFYPTVRGGIFLLCFALLVSLMIFGICFAVKRRYRIATAIGILKCRWHHRNIKILPPRESDPMYSSQNIEMPTNSQEDEREDEDEEKVEILSLPTDSQKADELITDSLAKSLIIKNGDVIYTEGTEKAVIDVDVLKDNFNGGEVVDVNGLKKKGIISSDVGYLRITGKGSLDKTLTVYANEFSLSAVKIIALCGGQAIKCVTLKGKAREEKE